MSNDTGQLLWNADTVPWQTIKAAVSIDIHTIFDDTADIDPEPSCTYSTREEVTGEVSKEFTFSRVVARPLLDPLENKEWMVTRGIENQVGTVAKAITGDGFTPVDLPMFRKLFSMIVGGQSIGTKLEKIALTDDDVISVRTQKTYTQIGPGDDCIIPANTDETVDLGFGIALSIEQTGNSFALTASVSGPMPVGGGPVQDTALTTPVTLKIHNLKTSGDSINFGGSASWHSADPGGYETWDVTWNLTLTMS